MIETRRDLNNIAQKWNANGVPVSKWTPTRSYTHRSTEYTLCPGDNKKKTKNGSHTLRIMWTKWMALVDGCPLCCPFSFFFSILFFCCCCCLGRIRRCSKLPLLLFSFRRLLSYIVNIDRIPIKNSYSGWHPVAALLYGAGEIIFGKFTLYKSFLPFLFVWFHLEFRQLEFWWSKLNGRIFALKRTKPKFGKFAQNKNVAYFFRCWTDVFVQMSVAYVVSRLPLRYAVWLLLAIII